MIFVALLAIIALEAFFYYLTKNKPILKELVPAQFSDVSIFLSPIKNSKKVAVDQKVTGIIVPHHLLAADLIADTFIKISKNNYNRVIIISPDHYFLGSRSISISANGFETVFGGLTVDGNLLSVLSKTPNVSFASFFYREHGIGADTNYARHQRQTCRSARKDLRAKRDGLQSLVELASGRQGAIQAA